jgi:polyvinyl alcohol dehydrogenase (cytochrome)
MVRRVGVVSVVLMAWAVPVSAQQAPDGEAVYKQSCATCHRDGQNQAPTRDALRQMTPESILNALTLGRMLLQANGLSEAEQRAVSVFLAGRPFAPPSPPVVVNRCTTSPPMRDPASAGGWNGWGNGVANTRFQPAANGGLIAADLPKLKLKWAFGYSIVTSARAQPIVAGGRLFVASENMEIHALDPKTGCTHWTYKAQAGVRTALSAGPYKGIDGTSGYAVYFGDSRANVYAVDASTGQLIWTRKVDDHRAAAITGAPTVHAGKVYVGVQGLNEEGQGGNAKYECCTFRGSLSALDANTGQVLWKTFTIDEPKPRVKNKNGVQQWGPAGGGIWAAPTIDPKRNMVYVATGNNYADPSQPTTDAVIAFDMNSGTRKWVNQLTPNDNWTLGCGPVNPDNPNCPEKLGPDFDFSASPGLVTVNNRDLLVIPQKSGMAYALDPDSEGQKVWEYRIGQGSGLGGQWGGAVDGQNAYFGVSDLLTQNPGGIRAVELATGKPVWSVGPQPRLCDTSKPTCRASQGAAVTVIPGAVFSGSLDGGMRAYSTTDGSIIWSFDTNREFQTVNGVKANGGGIEGPGPIVAGGMIFFNSGYGGFVGNPGNVLLAFGLD